jgi:hypothetical protein
LHAEVVNRLLTQLTISTAGTAKFQVGKKKASGGDEYEYVSPVYFSVYGNMHAQHS